MFITNVEIVEGLSGPEIESVINEDIELANGCNQDLVDIKILDKYYVDEKLFVDLLLCYSDGDIVKEG